MADLLIRDVPDHVINTIDANARRQGVSRAEYVRRLLARERDRTRQKVTVDDLRRFSELAQDLLDEDVMRRAWE